jgi:hypothetical protein
MIFMRMRLSYQDGRTSTPANLLADWWSHSEKQRISSEFEKFLARNPGPFDCNNFIAISS